MKKRSFLFAAAALVALSGFSTTSQATSLPLPSLVSPADTFSFGVVGYDSNGANGVYLIQPLTGQFGTTLTLAGTGAGGAQTVTVIGSETISGTTVTDTISVGVPANFIPTGTTNSAGGTINVLELDLGGYNGGTNTIDFLTAVNSPTYSGFIRYGANGASQLTLTASTIAANSVFNSTNTSLFTAEGISTTATAGLSQFAIRTFSFSISYSAVPEPSTYALCALGLAGFAGVVVRRRQAQA